MAAFFGRLERAMQQSIDFPTMFQVLTNPALCTEHTKMCVFVNPEGRFSTFFVTFHGDTTDEDRGVDAENFFNIFMYAVENSQVAQFDVAEYPNVWKLHRFVPVVGVNGHFEYAGSELQTPPQSPRQEVVPGAPRKPSGSWFLNDLQAELL